MYFDDILRLARELVSAGCRECSGLWIAMKFAGVTEYTPTARLMALACKLPLRTLVGHEAEDLKMLRWDIAPHARRCNILL